MLLLLAPAKKRMRVKIKIRPRYQDQEEGRSQVGPQPTTIPGLDWMELLGTGDDAAS